MAHFYGTLQGSRGEVTRCGSPNAGIRTIAASWQGSVRCYTYVDEKTGLDYVRVALEPWQGAGESRQLYDGPISGKPIKKAKAA